MYHMGRKRCHKGEYDTGLHYLMKAAELGDADAHYSLSIRYRKGEGVEKDEKKEIYHLEEAAIGGDPYARHNLGCVELENGRFERAKKHLIIAAELGCDKSMKAPRVHYSAGNITKQELEAAIRRAHKAAVDAMKNLQREAGEAFFKEEYLLSIQLDYHRLTKRYNLSQSLSS